MHFSFNFALILFTRLKAPIAVDIAYVFRLEVIPKTIDRILKNVS